MISDTHNLILVESPEDVDAANQEFYAKYPYPWPPMSFPTLEDPDFERVMLNQSIGDFDHGTIPVNPAIWVAGCGTNQAVYTALRFPDARVIGSDLSPASLEIAERNAATLGIRNLTLRQESLNAVNYREAFDYVVCTGVVHHNAEPLTTLARIASALRRGGVLELMVYNRFHRTFTTSFQKAIRTITRYSGRRPSYDEELEVAKCIAATEPIASSTGMAPFRNSHEAKLADAVIQPVEYSYTVESLSELLNAAGLELVLPCLDQFSHARQASWNFSLSKPELQARVDSLPDVKRWQLVNLLLLEKSPMLWFFAGHKTRDGEGHHERAIGEEFLNRRFVQAGTTLRNYVRGSRDLNYRLSPSGVPYPPRSRDPVIREIVGRTDGTRKMREILRSTGIDTESPGAVSDLRARTTTASCPYLLAVE